MFSGGRVKQATSTIVELRRVRDDTKQDGKSRHLVSGPSFNTFIKERIIDPCVLWTRSAFDFRPVHFVCAKQDETSRAQRNACIYMHRFHRHLVDKPGA
jgi:hypothetical protein